MISKIYKKTIVFLFGENNYVGFNYFMMALLFLFATCYPIYSKFKKLSEETHEVVIDEAHRIELFHECLAKIPKPSESTHYSDWSEVVESCDEISSSQARKIVREKQKYD